MSLMWGFLLAWDLWRIARKIISFHAGLPQESSPYFGQKCEKGSAKFPLCCQECIFWNCKGSFSELQASLLRQGEDNRIFSGNLISQPLGLWLLNIGVLNLWLNLISQPLGLMSQLPGLAPLHAGSTLTVMLLPNATHALDLGWQDLATATVSPFCLDVTPAFHHLGREQGFLIGTQGDPLGFQAMQQLRLAQPHCVWCQSFQKGAHMCR